MSYKYHSLMPLNVINYWNHIGERKRMNKTERDRLILQALNKFKVLSRNQLAYLACRENSNPVNVVNRVLKRMSSTGTILQVQRERDKPYIYMPNPAILHHRSVKLEHTLKIVDFYIHTGCPEHFTPEPNWKIYKPDVYMKDKKGNPICVEIQITPISSKKLQTKIDQFVSTYKKEHDSKVMFLVSNNQYDKVQMPKGFTLIRLPMPKEIYT